MDLNGVLMVTRSGTVRAERAAGLADTGDRHRGRHAGPAASSHGSSSTTVGGRPPGLAARGYRAGQPVPPFDLDAMPGTGDIWSTAADLTRFTAALHAGELIADGSLRAMCTPHAVLQDDNAARPRLTTTGYGYGMPSPVRPTRRRQRSARCSPRARWY